MPIINRSTLATEFQDVLSAKMLIQPEPEYFFAKLAMAAIGRSVLGGPIGLPGRQVPSGGAPYMSLEEQQLMLSDPIGANAIMSVAELGARPGHTIRMNRPSFTNSTYTLASRKISADSAISVSPLAINSEQVAITLEMFGGPYSSAVQPYAVNVFDAKMSLHSLESAVGLHLTRDYWRWLDSVVCTLLDQSATTIYVGTATADTDMVVAEDHPMDVDTLWRAVETLETANIPAFPNGRYCGVFSPKQMRQLKGDSQFAKLAEFHKDVNPLFARYQGSVGNLDLFVSNTLNTNASTTTVTKAMAFGPGKVAIGVGALPRVLVSTDDNYGLQPKCIWEAELGFAVTDSRFGISIHSN